MSGCDWRTHVIAMCVSLGLPPRLWPVISTIISLFAIRHFLKAILVCYLYTLSLSKLVFWPGKILIQVVTVMHLWYMYRYYWLEREREKKTLSLCNFFSLVEYRSTAQGNSARFTSETVSVTHRISVSRIATQTLRPRTKKSTGRLDGSLCHGS